MNIWPSLLQVLSQSFRIEKDPKQLELHVGEVVRATLLEMLDDGSAMLQVKGQTLRAQLETQLPKGASVSLVVIGPMENGALELKLLKSDDIIANVTQSQTKDAQKTLETTSAAIDRLLRNLGLKESPLLKMIVENLVTAKLSVSEQLVRTMESLVEQAVKQTNLPEASSSTPKISSSTPQVTVKDHFQQQSAENVQKAAVQVLTLMVRKQIPLSPAAFQAMNTLWNGPSLSELLLSLQKLPGQEAVTPELNQPVTQPAVQSDLKAIQQLEQSASALQQSNKPTAAKQQLEKMIAVEQQSVKSTAPMRQTGKATLDSSGLNLVTYTLQLDQLEATEGIKRATVIQDAANRLGLTHEHHLELLLNKSGSATLPADTLKPQLLALHEAKLGNQQDPAVTTVKSAELALHNLIGQQLMHAGQENTSPFSYQFMALPMIMGQQTADAKIHFLTRKQGKSLDPFNCYLYFCLTMPVIGELGIHVQVVEKSVSLRFILSDSRQLEIDDNELQLLRQGLQQAGYYLASVRTENAAVDSADPFSFFPITVTSGMLDLKI